MTVSSSACCGSSGWPGGRRPPAARPPPAGPPPAGPTSEALVNAAKHAGVDRVWVEVEERGCRLRVVVCDHGVGGTDPRRGTGLRGMQDRVTALGGTLVVDSPPGQGTWIIAELPCG